MSVQHFSSHGQSSTGSVVVTTTCATSPVSQITSKTKSEEHKCARGSRVESDRVAGAPVANFKLAQVQNSVEETGTWPVPLTCGLISFIPKGEGSAPQKLRPTGLMASEKWADTALHGYRPGRRAEHVWMDLSLSVESALVDGSDLVGMSVDWSNCFDRVPQRIAFQLAERQSAHLECCNLCVACTVSCEEGLLWTGHVEKEFVASHGIIQGCPLSVLLLNLLVNAWARSVKAGTTTTMPKFYADDAGVLSTNSEDIDIAFKITGRFATVTQQKTERGKKNQGLEHH